MPDTALGTWDSSVDTKILTQCMAYIEYRGRVKTVITVVPFLSYIASSSYSEVFSCLFLAISALKNKTKQTMLLL